MTGVPSSFVAQCAVLAALVAATWVIRGGRDRLGQARREPPPPDGHYALEVWEQSGLVLLHYFHSVDVRDLMAESWMVPGYAVLVRDPAPAGERWWNYPGKRVVYGDDLLENWEAVWPLTPR